MNEYDPNEVVVGCEGCGGYRLAGERLCSNCRLPVETEEQKERRLAREAANDCLDVLRDEWPTDSARVEVSYQREGDVERCGYLLVDVHVPKVDPADEDEWGANTPTQLAADRVHAWAEPKGFAYFSIDDTYAM